MRIQVDKRIECKTRYDAWKTSGLSASEWCRQQEIKNRQMYYWINSLKIFRLKWSNMFVTYTAAVIANENTYCNGTNAGTGFSGKPGISTGNGLHHDTKICERCHCIAKRNTWRDLRCSERIAHASNILKSRKFADNKSRVGKIFEAKAIEGERRDVSGTSFVVDEKNNNEIVVFTL
uniref:IS66 family insertion sequence element accessory protein TnpA n=1 Tax=Tigheibacillus jepli TaxID=3035914 RepID=UPI00387E0B35